jgi:enolase
MSDTAIASVRGRRVWDSRGRPTVEAELELAGGAVGRAIAPAGASTGSGEAVDLRDGGAAFGGFDVTRAVASVNEAIAPALRGMDAADQAALDARLVALDGTADKSRLGANATLAVSMAAAHAAAAAAGVPLYRHLGGDGATLPPLPQIQIFGGGAHAGRRVDVQSGNSRSRRPTAACCCTRSKSCGRWCGSCTSRHALNSVPQGRASATTARTCWRVL